jgi:DNA-binding NtrC family response regulator
MFWSVGRAKAFHHSFFAARRSARVDGIADAHLWVVKAILKILAVDDNPSIRQSMPFIFSAPRYEVSMAPDADHALAKLYADPHGYDVIIIDQKMPRMTGVELVNEINQRGTGGKILVLSAHLSPEICETYEQMDMQVILNKPFDVQQLRFAVDRLAA